MMHIQLSKGGRSPDRGDFSFLVLQPLTFYDDVLVDIDDDNFALGNIIIGIPIENIPLRTENTKYV